MDQQINQSTTKPDARAVTTAAAWRKKQPKLPPVTALLDLPSGAVVEVCRPNLGAWVAKGRLPQSFVLKSLKADKEHRPDDEAPPADKTTEDPQAVVEQFVAVRHLVCATVIKPRIVVGAVGDDEIDPQDVPDEDFFFIYRWVMSGADGVPIETADGPVSVGALDTFRDEAKW